jgi:hypothetical protein
MLTKKNFFPAIGGLSRKTLIFFVLSGCVGVGVGVVGSSVGEWDDILKDHEKINYVCKREKNAFCKLSKLN